MFETSAIAETQDISLVLRAGGSLQSRFLQLHRDASSHVFSPMWGSAWHLGFDRCLMQGSARRCISAAYPLVIRWLIRWHVYAWKTQIVPTNHTNPTSQVWEPNKLSWAHHKERRLLKGVCHAHLTVMSKCVGHYLPMYIWPKLCSIPTLQ